MYSTVKAHFIVESIKIAWSHFLVPVLSKKEITLNILPVTKFTLFQQLKI